VPWHGELGVRAENIANKPSEILVEAGCQSVKFIINDREKVKWNDTSFLSAANLSIL
jgi:hypothetical protein